jgi:uncharacterized membrane protein (DUF2068 family)
VKVSEFHGHTSYCVWSDATRSRKVHLVRETNEIAVIVSRPDMHGMVSIVTETGIVGCIESYTLKHLRDWGHYEGCIMGHYEGCII